MNIQLSVKELLEPLQTVISVIEKKQTLPILAHVLIQLKNNLLTLTTTDMEIEIKTSQIIKNKEKISFTIYAKDLINIINKLPENTILNFNINFRKINIKVNKNSFELNTFKHKDFPSLPKIKNKNIIKIKRKILKNLIENTSFSMGNQDIRAYLNGLYFEINKNNIIVVATDGHRLSIGKIKQINNSFNKKTVILPRKSILEFSKLLNKNKNEEINIYTSNNYFYLITNNTTIISKLINSKFPNYLPVIPTDFNNTIIINRLNFLNSLQQASIFVEKRTKGVKLIFKNSQLYIFSNSERGQAKTQIKTKNFNKKIEIEFNINYLISILEKLSTNEINMIIPKEKNKSCLLHSMNDDIYQYIVMPMRL
ncbi:DNA polymerase III subunit beta [Candidatus Vesicomyidisocius sp. SY067_SCS001]|uniref:DNA polymerase III subunit beta n=1 Tax=Candidatus Vesicomyidisocius sp. SY067_SCS001 TaxID=2732590 RepID=UPI0016880012|nr:DNA polymerase III subunit beta [Candidatus Vesicomyosocius sp. SY067_SCS001]